MNATQHAIKFSPLGPRFCARSHRKVSLGPLKLEICSNEPNFTGMRYFPAGIQLEPHAAVHYTVNFCNLEIDGPWPGSRLPDLQDTSYRARRFSMGYYLTDHFGPPAYMITRQTECWIFGSDFEQILWPYVVKYLLTIYSVDNGLLHLKAAGLAINGRGALLVARGGGGKTVLLSRLCQRGAQFLSNTHSLAGPDEIIGIPTAIRVRNDRFFGPLIAEKALFRAIKPGEFNADPVADLGWKGSPAATPAVILLADYRRPGSSTIREMSPNSIIEYMDQFSLALNVYGLREDLLDYFGSDVEQFALHTSAMRASLRSLVARCAGYYVSCDATDDRNLKALYDLIASASPGS
jgi:hypothetical protein